MEKPTYPVREASKLIVACNSITEIESMRNLLIQEIDNYPLADQGFLMTMTGLQIIKLQDGQENFDRFFHGYFFASLMQSNDN